MSLLGDTSGTGVLETGLKPDGSYGAIDSRPDVAVPPCRFPMSRAMANDGLAPFVGRWHAFTGADSAAGSGAF